MRKTFFILMVLISAIFMGSEPAYYYPYLPIFMKRADMEQSIRMESATPIKNPGKIYIKDQYIFINEKYRGIHIIDNSDPANPINKAFIHIDGCLDMAIKQNMLYADNSVDLLAIYLNPDMSSLTVGGRVRNALPEPSSPEGFWMNRSFEKYRPDNGIIVRWEKNLEY